MKKAFAFLLLLSVFLFSLVASVMTIDLEKASLDELLSARKRINERISFLQADSKGAVIWTEDHEPIVLYSDEDILVLFKGFKIEKNRLRFNIYVENNSEKKSRNRTAQ